LTWNHGFTMQRYAIARFMLWPYVCPSLSQSVCPSQIGVLSNKTVELIVTQTMPYGSQEYTLKSAIFDRYLAISQK